MDDRTAARAARNEETPAAQKQAEGAKPANRAKPAKRAGGAKKTAAEKRKKAPVKAKEQPAQALPAPQEELAAAEAETPDTASAVAAEAEMSEAALQLSADGELAAEPESEGEPESGSESEAENEPETGNEPESGNEPEAENEPETENEPESEREPESENEPETGSETENTAAVQQDAAPETGAAPADAKKKRRRMLGLVAAALLLIGGCAAYLWKVSVTPPQYLGCELLSADADAGEAQLRLTASSAQLFGKGLWLCLSRENAAPAADDPAWKPMTAGTCTVSVPGGVWYPFVLDEKGNVSAPQEQPLVNEVVAVSFGEEKTTYLAIGGEATLAPVLLSLGDADGALAWSSSDGEAVSVEGGAVTALSPATATVTVTTASGLSASAEVMATDLITLPNSDTYSKPMLYADAFTDEEAELLDEILAQRVADAGYGTRAGAVAAARFLALEFPYRVPYFFENGRMSPHEGRPYCDGEGRYYHQGLYLSETKFEQLEVIRFGPATWGEPLLNWEEKYHFKRGVAYPNGLDCSGFVCWVLLNGGSDVGDMGAGNEYGDNDLCDLAPRQWLTTELLQSDDIRVGDLIAEEGHMAIIIGLTDTHIYIAESLFTSVRVSIFTRDAAVMRSNLYDYIVPMEGIYEGDGNFTEMW